jgi:hypothetical protein
VLTINSPSAIQFYVTDPQGKRVGYTPAAGHLAELANANYYMQPPALNPATNTAIGSGMLELYIVDPVPGRYVLHVAEPASGNYSLLLENHGLPLVSNEISKVSGGTGKADAQYAFFVSGPLIMWQGPVYLPVVHR